MRLRFHKSKWETPELSLAEFLQRTAQDGFHGTELYLPILDEPTSAVRVQHADAGLDLIAQVFTEGQTPADHQDRFDRQFDEALEAGAVLINTHAGRDIFPFDANVRLFEHICARSRDAGVPVYVETHRRRPTYSAIETRRYLDAVADLMLTADVSHWMVVHESLLHDQEETLDYAIRRTGHVHARVGYGEGPQVPDPRAAHWSRETERHLEIWQRTVAASRASGREVLTITPEFGPPPYMHTHPASGEPLVDTWAVNVYVKNWLTGRLA
ncbi:MAG: TIM barrel protein [Bacteroidota bacterium]